MTDKPEESEAGTAGEKTPFSVRFAIFMALVSALVFLPTTIIFTVCMIPTLVAAIVDNHPQKTAWLTVGAMNMAGTGIDPATRQPYPQNRRRQNCLPALFS